MILERIPSFVRYRSRRFLTRGREKPLDVMAVLASLVDISLSPSVR